MELSPIKDAFDRVSKKQKLSCTKSQQVFEQVEREIEHALQKLHPLDDKSIDHETILADLKTTLDAFGSQNQLDVVQKELNVSLSKYPKSLDKIFIPDISKACRNVEFDSHTVNQIIANHFYQHGLFELGDCLITEAKEPDDTTFKSKYVEMYGILGAMRAGNLDPALNWVSTNSEKLKNNGSDLGLKLRKFQFFEILRKGNQAEALVYAKRYLAPFASLHMDQFQKAIVCLLWSKKLEKCPHSEVVDSTRWENLTDEITRQFCSVLGLSFESPLRVAVEAGFQGLPTLLKLVNVMASKKQEWDAMKQLPVPVDLGKEFQFHSIFVCPVSRDQGSEENPPMRMPCGHVLCRQSIMKLSQNGVRTFKCPYCPMDANIGQCNPPLYF